MKRFIVAAIFATSAFPVLAADDLIITPPEPDSLFLFSDTSVSFWHIFNASEPGIGTDIQKNVITLSHFDVWDLGTNFVNVDFLWSDNHDPAAPWGGIDYPIPPEGIGVGAFEVYGFFRSTLSWNSLFDTQAFTVGPLKDVSFYFGADANTKNTAFAPEKFDIVLGTQFAFNLIGTGYLNVAPVLYQEWNHNGIAAQLIDAGLCSPDVCSEEVTFDPTLGFELNYEQPLGDLPLKVRGFTNVRLPKGLDGFGAETAAEFHTENRLVLDVGQLVADKPGVFDAFVGHTYWQNKFGSNHEEDPTGGSTESSFFLGATLHSTLGS